MVFLEGKKAFLQKLFTIAVAAADPQQVMKNMLPEKPKGRTLVIGAGKASAQMAVAFENNWHAAGREPLSGLVVAPYGYGCETRNIEILEAGHPIPDMNGLMAAQRMAGLLQNLNEDDLVIALISGGGSALLPAPLEGMTLQDEIDVHDALLKSGAPISVMNAIRKHLSTIKGGRLALMAYPAKVISYIISDIPGDNAAQVASGPTIADHITRKDALQYIEQYQLKLPKSAITILNSALAEAPKPEHPAYSHNQVHMIASALQSLKKAADYALSQGIKAIILSDSIEGEAKDIGLMHAAIARNVAQHNQPFCKPVVMLSGGETTVTLNGKSGKGGRNSEFLLSFACAIDGEASISCLAADTDGRDGSENNAGAYCDGKTAMSIRQRGFCPSDFLNNHDTWSAFQAIDMLLVTGPTGTNVNDFRAILIAD